MRKKVKIGILVVIGLFVLIFVAALIASPIVENKIKKHIATQLPAHVKINDYNLSVSLIKGSVEIKDLKLSPKQETSNVYVKQFVSVDRVLVSGVSYLKLLFGNEIKIKKTTIDNPVVQLDKITNFQSFTANNSEEKSQQPQSFHIDQFIVKGIDIKLYENDTVPYLSLTQAAVTFMDIVIDEKSRGRKIPFRYKSYEVQSESFSVLLNPFDRLSLSSMTIKDRELLINDFSIKTQYEKNQLAAKLKIERDYVDLVIPQIKAHNFDLNEQNDSLLVGIQQLHFKEPKADIYRDKRVADDLSEKPIYSKSLRSLPFLLAIDTAFIDKASVVYEEKINSDHPPGKVYFSNIQVDITHLGNAYRKMNADISATFMDNTPLHASWLFDIKNPDDTFVFKGQLGKLQAKALNSFTKPNLNVELEGVLGETFFTIDANNYKSSVRMRLKYEDFKVEIFNKENKKNKFLSAVTNLFVKKKSTDKKGVFKEGKATVHRNLDKSVFNYLWVNLKAGLKNIMLGL